MSVDQAATWIHEAEAHLLRGRPQEAADLLARVVLIAPNNARAQVLLGVAKADLGAVHEAKEAFEKAIEFDPLSANAHYNLGVYLRDQAKPELAIVHAQRAAELDPDDPDIRNLLSELGGSVQTPPISRQPSLSTEIRPGFGDDNPAGALPFLDKLGVFWPLLGWAFSLAGTTGFAMLIYGYQGEFGKLFGAADAIVNFLPKTTVQIWGMNLSNLALVVGIVWVAFDFIHRRREVIWLILIGVFALPVMAIGVGFSALPLLVYMIAGMKGKR